ncbi:MAG: DUF4402 domain-containing protein [Desulfamplus sp.]|nr:DUF4402 domain-containing protein [Desulfamplus sp.]
MARNKVHTFSIFFRTLFILCFCLNAGFAKAADVSLIRPISFGAIVVDPAGEIIEIDASGGPALPRVFTSGNSYVNGGFSGIIRVVSDISGQVITLDYPVSFALQASGSPDLVLDGIAARSTHSPVTSDAVGHIDFNIGGLLHINSGQSSKNFSGTMTINIDIVNP